MISSRRITSFRTSSGPRHAIQEAFICGSAATLLDGIVTRLSLEPGVHAVSWQSEDPDTRDDDDRDEHHEPADLHRRWRRSTPMDI